MRILWTHWQITEFAPNSPPANSLQTDPTLTELAHDLNVTRTIVIAGFLLGLTAIGGLWVGKTLKDSYTAFFWALACYASGTLMGFLFGIPRVLQQTSKIGGSPSAVNPDSDEARPNYEMIINTNLDDISDWLTKIVIGVGLVELQRIPGLIYSVAKKIATSTGADSLPFIIALILYFTVVGFIAGYLTTRMFFQRAFRIADLAASGRLEPRTVKGGRLELETHNRPSTGTTTAHTVVPPEPAPQSLNPHNFASQVIKVDYTPDNDTYRALRGGVFCAKAQ